MYEQESRPVSDPTELAGTRWLLRSLDGRPQPDDFPAVLYFGPSRKVSGYDGCLHFTGRFYANENDLTVPEYGYKAEEACMKPGAHGETRDLRLEDAVPPEGNYILGEGCLEVRDDSGKVSVYEPLRKGVTVEEPGSAWRLESFVEGGRTTPVLEGTRITLRFDRGTLRETGTLSGFAGCNAYSAGYELAGDYFSAGTPEVAAVTRKHCPAPAGVMEQERRFLDSLEDIDWVSTNIDGTLELSTRGGGGRMIFVAPH